ncbi:hypothetical protein D4R49_01685 [bacterium]|nr:MAG: hypothetical protein D4R49_01685 [bacterium]
MPKSLTPSLCYYYVMTIAETREKCKGFLARIPRDVLILSVLLVASSASFALGLLAGLEAGQGGGISTLESPIGTSENPATTTGQFVASKSGTKYYSLGCSGADRISSANKVFFPSASAAVAAGYAPAANCKGL